MQREYSVPEQVREISKYMRVVDLGYVLETKDPWKELTGMFTIGRRIDVEGLIKNRWLEYDDSIGF